MSQKANPTLIGLFIVTGVALGVIGVLLFGSSRLFTSATECILYFNSSLNGLNEGAPVKYRGVTIGSVKRVMIRYNQATNDFALPVIIEIREDLLSQRLGDAPAAGKMSMVTDDIRRGLRGSLEAESLVTGVLYVDLDKDPYASPPVFHQLKQVYFEIPTRPTEIQQLIKNLSSLDLAGLEKRLSALIDKVDATLGNLRANEISTGLTNLLTSLNRVVATPNLTNAVAELNRALEQYRLLAENLNRRVDPLAASVTNTLAQADQTLAQLRGSAENLRGLLAPDSALRSELTLALEQLADAARSISSLAEFLEQHPNALITGRKSKESKP